MWVNKNNLCVLILAFIAFVGVAQTTAIPDPNFEQALIDLGYDSGPLDGLVLTANISGVTNLDIPGRDILNLTGIQDFINLTVLNCNTNSIKTLNVSQNTKLTQLYCDGTAISTLDVSSLPDLEILWCDHNFLSNLDVSNNKKLISLTCSDNLLTNLNLTQNTFLNVLVCEMNQFTTLDLSKNINLSLLWCGYNKLTNLDVSNNVKMRLFKCENNLLNILDLTKNILLEELICVNNQISTLNISQNNLLTFLNCNNNFINNLDVSNNSNLNLLFVNNNQLNVLDISNNKALKSLDCRVNDLCELNLKNGFNQNISLFNSNFNPNLSCIIVDNVNYSNANWSNIDATSKFVASKSDCDNLINISTLENVVTNNNYTLPPLTYGKYYTKSGGNGNQLFAGNIISTSQTIYIFNQTICNSNESSFNVLITAENYYIPKYFTPNNDGTNDVWRVEDFTNTIESITIYNRYGKLLKSLTSNSSGWNGNFNGNLLIRDTYWYVITLITGKTIKGHFALKR